MTKREPCPASNSPAHLTLRHDKGKVALSSSAYKYPRRGCREEGGKTEQNREGNIRKKIEKGRDDFFEKERNTREGKILEERRRTEREE